MNLLNYSTAMSKFKSTLESPALGMEILGHSIPDGAAVISNSVRDLLLYLSNMYTKEAIIDTKVNLLDLDIQNNIDEATDYATFIDSTYREDKPSYHFQTTDMTGKPPLTFKDIGLLGASNTYRPFDSVDEKVFNTQLSASLEEIKVMSSRYFKHKAFRGIVGFERPMVLAKGYTIYFIDKKLYATIIASSYSLSTGYGTYVAILYTGK